MNEKKKLLIGITAAILIAGVISGMASGNPFAKKKPKNFGFVENVLKTFQYDLNVSERRTAKEYKPLDMAGIEAKVKGVKAENDSLKIEEIKNGSEKSLIMGFVLTNLCEALKAKYKENRHFKHITLIEEAHRLLAKFTPGDSPNRKQGIETFTDMLAEVRKYGESLIIADQIPNKLTPEILKNTNTKIVHKLFAEDDKEAIGATMSLSSEQKNFLSSLNTGRARLG